MLGVAWLRPNELDGPGSLPKGDAASTGRFEEAREGVGREAAGELGAGGFGLLKIEARGALDALFLSAPFPDALFSSLDDLS